MKYLMLGLILFVSCEGERKVKNNNTFIINISGDPSTLNPISSSDGHATQVFNYVFEALLSRNIDTYEWEPQLAESWEVSKDKKTFTFKLRENIFWHDGKPITVEDVLFSYEVIFKPESKAAHKIPYYENIKSIKDLGNRVIEFKVKDDYFMNFDVAAGLMILPKHYYGDQNQQKNFNKIKLYLKLFNA